MPDLVQRLVAPGVSLCHSPGFLCCYHIIYSFSRSSEAFALFFSNAITGMFWSLWWKMLLLGWPVARKVNSEIDNLSNKMPSVQAGTLQLSSLIKFFSFLFSEFIICTQQYLLERPLKIDNSINKHINYYCPKNVSSFFSLFLLPQSLDKNVLEMFLSWNNSNTY